MREEFEDCQHYALCGGYCETADELSAGLCESCLSAERDDAAAVLAAESVAAALRAVVAAWDGLPGPSRVSTDVVQHWLINVLAPAIADARKVLPNDRVKRGDPVTRGDSA